MAWEARWGLKQYIAHWKANHLNRLNGVGGPLGIETIQTLSVVVGRSDV